MSDEISAPLYRVDLLPPFALLSAARIMAEGERKGISGWSDIAPEVHVSSALTRIQRYIADQDDAEDHLAHAVCRLLMAAHIVAKRQETHDPVTRAAVDGGLARLQQYLDTEPRS